VCSCFISSSLCLVDEWGLFGVFGCSNFVATVLNSYEQIVAILIYIFSTPKKTRFWIGQTILGVCIS